MISIAEFTYTREDFDTTKPYEDLCKIEDPFQQNRHADKLNEYAKTVDFKGFKAALKAYRESLKNASTGIARPESFTKFDEQAFELDTGEWTADDSGVWKVGGLGGLEIACPHPIMPVERLRNIDTGELKVRLAFRRGGRTRRTWIDILTDFDTVSNAKNIVSLSRIGVSVTSGKRAQNLVDYLAEVMDRNYDIIPEVKSVSRMGWNPEGFSPYVDGVVFDGNENFKRTFEAISPVGDLSAWLDEALDARTYSITARIMLAASFASVLVEPIGCLPFFVHLWGMDSGTGKTVGQMLAASVWANPAPGGDYFKTFRSTAVGFEVTAGFLNSLPYFIDELQLAKDHKGKVIFNVYELAAGSGKTRATKSLGLASTSTWSNCFITSGESPLVGEQDGAGVANRVIEIECKANEKVIRDGHRTANVVKTNYGHAGLYFIKRLTERGELDRAKKIYEAFYKDCLADGTTEKQAMAAAIILTGDCLATEYLFPDGNALTVKEIAEFLKSKEAVSAAERGYAHMCDWVSMNAAKFSYDPQGEVYGVIDDGWAYIIRSAWNEECTKAGISAQALLSHLKSRELIQTRARAYTKPKKIGKIATECVVMRLPREEFEEISGDDPEFPWPKNERGGTK